MTCRRAFSCGGLWCGVLLLAACATSNPTLSTPAVTEPPSNEAQVHAVLSAFCENVEKREFTATWKLLSTSLRQQYSPVTLEADFDKEPTARARMKRLCAMAGEHLTVVDDRTARLPLGQSFLVELIREDDGWRIAQLE